MGEHLLKLIRVYAHGEFIFGNLNEFKHWIQKPPLGSSTPNITLLVTSGGCDHVYEQLEAIAHGLPL